MMLVVILEKVGDDDGSGGDNGDDEYMIASKTFHLLPWCVHPSSTVTEPWAALLPGGEDQDTFKVPQ